LLVVRGATAYYVAVRVGGIGLVRYVGVPREPAEANAKVDHPAVLLSHCFVESSRTAESTRNSTAVAIRPACNRRWSERASVAAVLHSARNRPEPEVRESCAKLHLDSCRGDSDIRLCRRAGTRNHAAPLSFGAVLGCRAQVAFGFRTLAPNLEGTRTLGGREYSNPCRDLALYSGSWITGNSERQQTPYCCQSRNHGLFASILSCLRFAAARSLGLSGLVSGSAKMRSRHSISAIVCSASIPSQYPTWAWQSSNGAASACRACEDVLHQTGVRVSQHPLLVPTLAENQMRVTTFFCVNRPCAP
jgi:hypothetical protein